MAFDYVRLGTDAGVERIRFLIRLLVQGDLHERGHGQPDGSLVDEGGIAADDALPFEIAHAAQARGLRQPDAGRQFDVGKPAIVLEELEDLAFCAI